MKHINFDLGIKVISHAGYVPQENRYSNIELMKVHPAFMDQPQGRLAIFSRRMTEEFGFLNRSLSHLPGTPISPTELTTEDLAFKAMKMVEEKAPEWKPELFIHGTTTTSRYTGSQATSLAGQMGWHLPSYETRCGCATALGSMHLAWSLLKGPYTKVAIACAETLSKVINPNNRDDWFGMSDGAASIYIEKDEVNPDFKVIGSVFFTKGEHADLYTTTATLPPHQPGFESGGYFLNGDAGKLRIEAKDGYNEMLSLLLPDSKDRASVNWVIPHQVNLQLVKEVKEENSIGGELVLNAQEVGNIGGSSILYTLSECLSKSLFKKGDRILFMSVGGGLSVAGQIWEKC